MWCLYAPGDGRSCAELFLDAGDLAVLAKSRRSLKRLGRRMAEYLFPDPTSPSGNNGCFTVQKTHGPKLFHSKFIPPHTHL